MNKAPWKGLPRTRTFHGAGAIVQMVLLAFALVNVIEPLYFSFGRTPKG